MELPIIKKGLVVGCGAMGCGIAYIMAKYCQDSIVHVVELDSSTIDDAKEKMIHWQTKDLNKPEEGITSPFVESIKFFSGFDKLDDGGDNKYDLLIEAAREDMQTKQKIFAEFDKIADSETLIASNTSSLSITQMTAEISAEKKHQVVGLHFFNPPKIIKLLEIIVSELTSDETIQRAREIGEALRKTTVVCKDAPGFITSRIGIIAVNEAIFILQERLATPEDIDQAMKLGYNHPMGPLKLADFIGLDVVFAVTQSLYENYQDSKYRPPILLRKKVEAGQLGVKTGIGFYQYPMK